MQEHVFHSVFDEFWRRPENGGDGDPRSIATVRAPAYMSTVFQWNNNSRKAVDKLAKEDLAAWLSRCRVEAAAFDGLESFILPVYDASPGAMVLVMSWRTWEQYRKSRLVFGIEHAIHIFGIAY